MNFVYDYEDYKEIKKVTEILKEIEEINKIKYKTGNKIKEENTEFFVYDSNDITDTSIWFDSYVPYNEAK